MGSSLAPAYANMGKLEKSILDTTKYKPKYYRRFIDDIIFEHSETELDNFMNNANKAIKFTHEKSLTTVTFLDVTIYKEKDKPILHKTHIKPTNKPLYVKYDSHHPPGTFKGMIIGEAIRFRRTNSKATHFHKIILKHKHKLQKRGYPTNFINKHLKAITFHNPKRNGSSKTNNTSNNRPIFKTKYCNKAGKTFHAAIPF